MIARRHIFITLWLISAIMLAMCAQRTRTVSRNSNPLVRVAAIEIDTSQIKAYNGFLSEEIEASIRLEPGVIALYGIAEKEHPERVTLFETYADSNQYRSHLATAHFQKYKQGTLQMVKHLDLIPMQPILYHRKPDLSSTQSEDLYIRLIKIELHPNTFEDFKKLGNTAMLPGITKEPGILVMYAVAEKNNPTNVSILEVYQNVTAYNVHVETPHYLKYKEGAKGLVKSLRFIDAYPILLGSKPQQ